MPEWIQHYWVEWLFGIIAACLLALYRGLKKRINEEFDQQKALKSGMRSFLRRQIIADCEQAIQQGYATTTFKGVVEDMYLSYHALEGNGIVTHLYSQFMDLPVVPHES